VPGWSALHPAKGPANPMTAEGKSTRATKPVWCGRISRRAQCQPPDHQDEQPTELVFRLSSDYH
jgi:hypothetical protein